MDILIATTNKGKLREYTEMLGSLSMTILSIDDVGLGDLDVVEDGDTFQKNAEIKARAYARASGKLTIADDSGLCVDALQGAPGVHSARYGGDGLDDAGRRTKLLEALDGVRDEKRTAHFECVIAVADPDSPTCLNTHGVCQGRILHEEQGTGGFGYDPIFLPDGYSVTFAEIDRATKNRISHRGEATRQLVPILRSIIREKSM
jgi:XTP/dITP diphosphohydrolase